MIFVVEAAQNRRRDDSVVIGQLVARRPDHSVRRRIRNPGSQAAMWPAAVVMPDPLAKNRAKMPLAHRNHEVQALAPHGPDQAFAERICLWNANRRLEHFPDPSPRASDRRPLSKSCRDRGLRIDAPDRQEQSSETAARSSPLSGARSRSNAGFDVCRLPGRQTHRSRGTWP